MKRFLVIQTAFIGDVILATSFIEALSSNFPNSKIDFVLRKGNEGILDNNPHLNNVFAWDKQKKWSSLVRTIKELRKYRYESVFVIQRFFNAGLIAVLAKSKNKAGFRQNPLSFFFTHRIDHKIPHYLGPEKKSYLHETQRNLQLLSAVHENSSAKAAAPKLYFNDSIEKKISSLVPSQKDYLVMAPTSVWFTKQWSAQRWSELALKLCHAYELIFIGAPADRKKIQSIIQNVPGCRNLAGKLSLLESAKIMQNAKRVFVNDSAPLHLASAVNAKTTAIFCSTIKDFGYFPLGQDSSVVEYEESLPCRPCGLHGKKSCPLAHFTCSVGITADQVAKTLANRK